MHIGTRIGSNYVHTRIYSKYVLTYVRTKHSAFVRHLFMYVCRWGPTLDIDTLMENGHLKLCDSEFCFLHKSGIEAKQEVSYPGMNFHTRHIKS
jgi:hypothetical protein